MRVSKHRSLTTNHGKLIPRELTYRITQATPMTKTPQLTATQKAILATMPVKYRPGRPSNETKRLLATIAFGKLLIEKDANEPTNALAAKPSTDDIHPDLYQSIIGKGPSAEASPRSQNCAAQAPKDQRQRP